MEGVHQSTSGPGCWLDGGYHRPCVRRNGCWTPPPFFGGGVGPITIERLKDDMCEYEVIKGYHVDSDEIKKETMGYLRVLWNSRQRYERLRDCGLD